MLTLFDPKMLAHPGDHEKRKKLGGRSAAPPPRFLKGPNTLGQIGLSKSFFCCYQKVLLEQVWVTSNCPSVIMYVFRLFKYLKPTMLIEHICQGTHLFCLCF